MDRVQQLIQQLLTRREDMGNRPRSDYAASEVESRFPTPQEIEDANDLGEEDMMGIDDWIAKKYPDAMITPGAPSTGYYKPMTPTGDYTGLRVTQEQMQSLTPDEVIAQALQQGADPLALMGDQGRRFVY